VVRQDGDQEQRVGATGDRLVRLRPVDPRRGEHTADALGAEAALSKSTVSRVCQAIFGEFATWSECCLEDLKLDYLFLEASMVKMHAGARAEPVLAGWASPPTARRCSLRAAGDSGSADASGDFLDELINRGLRPPLLVNSNGTAGLINACRDRAGGPLAAATLSDPPSEEFSREGGRRSTRRAARRVLGDLLHRRAHRRRHDPRPAARRCRAGPHRRLRDTCGRAFPAAFKCLLTDRDLGVDNYHPVALTPAHLS